jgi:hypothetical protein
MQSIQKPEHIHTRKRLDFREMQKPYDMRGSPEAPRSLMDTKMILQRDDKAFLILRTTLCVLLGVLIAEKIAAKKRASCG